MSKIKKDLEELKKLDEEIESDGREGPTALEQMDTFNPKDFMDGDKLYFKSEHIIPILKKMTHEQIEIFEHLTGIYRQTLH